VIPITPLRLAKLLKLGKVIGVIACAAFLGWCVWTVYGWKQKADDNPLLHAEIAELHQFLEQYEKDIREVMENDRAHENEIEMLRTAARSERIPVVRLCVTPDPPVRRLPAPARIGDEAAPGAGELPQAADGDLAAGPDIAPELYAEADRADEIVAQARAAQAHAEACSRNGEG
jgi:hypothetical protein